MQELVSLETFIRYLTLSLVTRTEASFRLILNMRITKTTSVNLLNDKSVSVFSMSPEGATGYCLKFNRVEEAAELLRSLKEHIATKESTDTTDTTDKKKTSSTTSETSAAKDTKDQASTKQDGDEEVAKEADSTTTTNKDAKETEATTATTESTNAESKPEESKTEQEKSKEDTSEN